VQYPTLVGIVDASGDFDEKTYRRGCGHTQRIHFSLLSALLHALRGEICLDPRRQIAALDQLHAEEMLALRLPDFVDRDNVGATAGADATRLAARSVLKPSPPVLPKHA
jgi:hypothetical protein